MDLFTFGLQREAFKTPYEPPGATCASGQISTGAATRPFYTDAIAGGELAVYLNMVSTPTRAWFLGEGNILTATVGF